MYLIKVQKHLKFSKIYSNKVIQRFTRQKVGKSEDLGPKTCVFRDMRTNNMGKKFDMIYRVMRDSHV